MGRKRNRGEDVRFIKYVKEEYSKQLFLDFDVFIIREMGYSVSTKQELEQVRRQAFLTFRKRTDHYPFASLPTMRRWFGIRELNLPRREQVFGICLQLQTGRKKAEEYLTVGLGEISFQIRDYREVIFMYGLEQKLTYQETLQLIEQFESRWDFSVVEADEKTPFSFEKEQEEMLQLSPDAFLSRMLCYQNYFIGYSDDVMHTLLTCRSKIMVYIRRDAKGKLESLLSETNYKNWLKEKAYDDLEPREILRRFLKARHKESYKEISQHMRENILELSAIAYSPLEANSKLLSEIFSHTGKSVFHQVRGMSAKHLSDLFNISLQRKRAVIMKQAQRKLLDMAEESSCPDWIKHWLNECTRHPVEPDTVQDALNWCTHYNNEQKRRCINIKRSDILPMIHYIAQREYLDSIEDKEGEYDAVKAKEKFISLADHMLQTCRMSPVNEAYELDAALLACFQPDEMYSFPELLDLVGNQEILNER